MSSHSVVRDILDLTSFLPNYRVVEFTREDDAAQAIKELDDYEILGRKLKVREVYTIYFA